MSSTNDRLLDVSSSYLEDVQATGLQHFPAWHRTLLANGVNWPPSNYEAAFLTLAHGARELDALRDALRAAFEAVAGSSVEP